MLFYSHYFNQSPNRKVEITLSISDRDDLLWGLVSNASEELEERKNEERGAWRATKNKGDSQRPEATDAPELKEAQDPEPAPAVALLRLDLLKK